MVELADNPLSLLKDITDSKSFSKLKDFFGLVKKSKEKDCDEDPDDCGEFLSPCHKAILEVEKGTFPVEVRCVECGKTFVLRELAESL